MNFLIQFLLRSFTTFLIPLLEQFVAKTPNKFDDLALEALKQILNNPDFQAHAQAEMPAIMAKEMTQP
jgi:hypothetical protein